MGSLFRNPWFGRRDLIPPVSDERTALIDRGMVGLGLLTVMFVMAARGRFSVAWHTPVEISGLYWHFVDIIWIFLFPLLYLVDRHR